MNDFKLYQFPVTKTNLDRISKNNKQVIINFNRENIHGEKMPLTPVLAYGENPCIDHETVSIYWNDDFSNKLKKISVYRKVKTSFNKMIKSLNELDFEVKIKKKKFELYVNYDNSGFDFLSEEESFYANASVSLKTLDKDISNNYLILNKSDYQKLRKSLVDLQKKINNIMNEFVEETQDLFYNKKRNLNKFNNLDLDIEVA